MTQLETMQHAKQYLDQLSNGTDPITQKPLKRDDPLATERLQKCFAYVSGILGQVIANGGQILARHPSRKLPFSLSEEALAQVAISETPIPIKAFAANVNARIDPQASRPLSPVAVTNWLVEKGYLTEITRAQNKRMRVASPLGQSIGIISEERVSRTGVPFMLNLYHEKAQRFLLLHLQEITAEQHEHPTPAETL